ncbi:MAG: hypothetical protein ACEB74_13890 [Desulfovibrio aminophilus]|uniref:hypothetical protein n=1 Tax=Desulfovibrio aminophilus TaxID=81425 RepID=UPI0039ED22A9
MTQKKTAGLTGKAPSTKDLLNAEAHLYTANLALAQEYARKKGWDADSWNALYLLFAEKWGWTPSQVRGLTQEEISLFLDYLTPSRS